MAITVKAPNEVSPALRKLNERALTALENKNFDYAMQMFRDLLLKEPGFNEARLNLRQAQLERIGFSVSPMRRITAMVTTLIPVYLTGPAKLKKGEFAQALDCAESAMDADPTLLSTLRFLKTVAIAAGLKEIAVNAMEIAVRFNAKNPVAFLELSKLYQETNQARKALEILQKLRGLKPNSLEVANELKHATALAAMEAGRWEQAESYKDVMKDKEQAELLEQEGRLSARDEDSRQKLIAKAREEVEARPGPGGYKKLAALLHQDRAYDEAIEAYGKVMELAGAFDPSIDASISDVISDSYADQIYELKQQLPDAGEAKQAEIQNQIDELIQERDGILVERLEKRVENFPNELNFRFELGALYWEVGRVDDALQQFQQAQRNPHLARKAQLYMGKCLSAKGLYEMAIEQFDLVLADKDKVSGQDFKDALYETGLAAEKQGNEKEAMKRFKELFSVDVNFRDVSQRLEKFYAQTREKDASNNGDDA
jgi:tetratricopeptide (TPR) repeat protein